MRIDIITLFPEILSGALGASMLKRAQEAGAAQYHLHQLRDYATDKHHTVDEKPYGGGPGMLLKCEPVFAAVEAVQAMATAPESGLGHIVLLSATGKQFTQAKAQELAQRPRIIFLCGHYEGMDERVREHLIDEEISIGDYVLTNGAVAALVVIDAVVRLLPGVVGNELSTESESFSPANEGLLEGPQYTRPEAFRSWRVPEVLLSGDHARIRDWQTQQARARTLAQRPDLMPQPLPEQSP
jgi:tRNA (guanine37-N1)-methyltransferase